MNKELIEKVVKRGRKWDLANKFLYNLFEENYDHDQDSKILAKTWLLGRSYSVALERRARSKYAEDKKMTPNEKTQFNNKFYTTIVTKIFKNAKFNTKLLEFKGNEFTTENLIQILSLHLFLSKMIRSISGQNRSFASKYLHFHLPNSYYIYDSKATQKINKILKNDIRIKEFVKQELLRINLNMVDKEYAIFFLKCMYLQRNIKLTTGLSLSTREIDDLLIYLKENEIRQILL